MSNFYEIISIRHILNLQFDKMELEQNIIEIKSSGEIYKINIISSLILNKSSNNLKTITK
jgi:hypothetical protein